MPTELTADEIIAALGLQKHPLEGGYFFETYRTPQTVPGDFRSLSTAIYYLLTPQTCSRMHRLPGDELFHFYLGDPVQMLHLFPDGTSRELMLGNDLRAGHLPQVVVPGGVWQGATLAPGGKFALIGTTMAPGFHFPDYEQGNRAELTRLWPRYELRIAELTPKLME